MSNQMDLSTNGKKGEGKSIVKTLKINASYMVAYDSHEDSIVSFFRKQR